MSSSCEVAERFSQLSRFWEAAVEHVTISPTIVRREIGLFPSIASILAFDDCQCKPLLPNILPLATQPV